VVVEPAHVFLEGAQLPFPEHAEQLLLDGASDPVDLRVDLPALGGERDHAAAAVRSIATPSHQPFLDQVIDRARDLVRLDAHALRDLGRRRRLEAPDGDQGAPGRNGEAEPDAEQPRHGSRAQGRQAGETEGDALFERHARAIRSRRPGGLRCRTALLEVAAGPVALPGISCRDAGARQMPQSREEVDERSPLVRIQRRQQLLHRLLEVALRAPQQFGAVCGQHDDVAVPPDVSAGPLDQAMVGETPDHGARGRAVGSDRPSDRCLAQPASCGQRRQHVVLRRGESEPGEAAVEQADGGLMRLLQQDIRSGRGPVHPTIAPAPGPGP